MPRLILFNKPYDVLCQFSDPQGRPTLAQYLRVPHVYPAGRLDQDSEGLLLLTDAGWLQHRISDPSRKLPKTYWVQVEGTADEAAVRRLATGVRLKDGMTKPASVAVMSPPHIWARTPPIRVRRHIPTTWLSITLVEGRNRQIRRMTAAVGLPTLRLVRWAIGLWDLGSLQPGEWEDAPVPERNDAIGELP
jgi:23S rRNA pseudouridine2457 synthase